ncbi:MAG: sigmaY antisigma factor component [Firmicutes bacterium]|nr:sigmaY antisigma factor component [Bacillota bacterium]
MDTIAWWGYRLLAVLVLTQALWIFHDARKRGENAWLWGLLGLLNVPSSLLVYLLVTRRKKRDRN